MRHLIHMLALALLFSGTSVAAQNFVEDKWQWSGAAYFWGASIDGTSDSGADVQVGLDTIIDNLKFGAMGTLNAQKGNLSFFGDLIYLDLGDTTSTTVPVLGVPVPVSADIDLKGLISTAGVGYQIYDQSGTKLEALGGARLLKFDSDINISVGGRNTRLGSSTPNWDAIVGLRGSTDLSEKWYLNYYADIGTGDSDFTWQALVGVNYRMKKADITAGYRYLSWDFGQDSYSGFSALDLSGFYLGARFDF